LAPRNPVAWSGFCFVHYLAEQSKLQPIEVVLCTQFATADALASTFTLSRAA
jgi:hypothetical protein